MDPVLKPATSGFWSIMEPITQSGAYGLCATKEKIVRSHHQCLILEMAFQVLLILGLDRGAPVPAGWQGGYG